MGDKDTQQTSRKVQCEMLGPSIRDKKNPMHTKTSSADIGAHAHELMGLQS